MATTAHKNNSKRRNGQQVKVPIVAKTPQTASYKPLAYSQWFGRPRDLPPFSFGTVLAMLLDSTLRLGLAMRAAPLFGIEWAYKKPGSEEWTPGIKCDNPVVGAYVQRQLERIWKNLDALVTAQTWGWAAAEVQWRMTRYGRVEIDNLLPRHANDTRALVRDGEICGVRFLQIKDIPGGMVDLPFPKAVFHAHAPDAGFEYGTSILQGAHSPWADKWLNGGALDVRRLFMHKDAYGGADISYPPGFTNIDGKGDVPNRDIAREIVEQMQAGAVTARPSEVDSVTKTERWTITRATVPSNPQHILQYPKDLDIEMLRGMEIPDEVFMPSDAGTTGYSGKSIPMQGFYTGLDRWAIRLIGDIDKQVIRRGVDMNFGEDAFYEITHKPLGLQAMEQQGEGKSSQQGGPSPFFMRQPGGGQDDDGSDEGGSNGQGRPIGQAARMSLDPVAAVGRGVLSAAEMVRAAKSVMAVKLSTEPHSYSSTQFNLPGELAFEVRRLGERIPADDLAEDGRENEPHVTVKYGLHTNDPEDVRDAVFGEPPVAIQLGPCSYFEGESYDVVKIDVESKGLHALNARLCDALPHTDTYPDYRPHITVAYVKKGLGAKYAATLNDLQGRTAVFDRLVFSDKLRNWTSVPLTGKAVRFSTEAANA